MDITPKAQLYLVCNSPFQRWAKKACEKATFTIHHSTVLVDWLFVCVS